jgi:hypothetical protein
MTLVVLGMDAMDAEQVEYFDCENMILDTYGGLETVAYDRTYPYTLQVWPTIATGLSPTEHGVAAGGESEWDNPFLELASKIISPRVSMQTRAKLGRIAESVTESEWKIGETDEATFFDGEGRFVHNWPGVTESHWVERIWREIDRTADKGVPQEDFDRRIWGIAGQQFGWIREMLDHDASLVASHIHILDPSGHSYSTNEKHYREFYEKVDRYIGKIRRDMDDEDELLILSDHGMQVEWLGDDDISEHSWRAFSASTLSTRPTDVHDVREWIEDHIKFHEKKFEQRGETNLDLPEDTLRDLGYIE